MPYHISMIMLLADLSLFWAMIITTILSLLHKVNYMVPVVLLILFVILTILFFACEIHYAITEDELMGKKPDNNHDDNDTPPTDKDA